jgi:phosphate transport system protein
MGYERPLAKADRSTATGCNTGCLGPAERTRINMNHTHLHKQYEDELQKLRNQISQMGDRVVNMIANSVRALVERDSKLAHRMIAFDDQIDCFEVETNDLSLGILARRQLIESDLRFITAGLKLITALERIGDLCVAICERAIELNVETPLKTYEDLSKMGDVAQEMVCEVLSAFIESDPVRAQQVIERDRAIDTYYVQLFSKLPMLVMQDSKDIYRATRVDSVAKHLERIGDDATNLAEMVVSMVKGKDIGHLGGIKRAQ